MLAQQTDQPVARVLTGTTSIARAVEVGAAMVRTMRLAQQSAGLGPRLSSELAPDQQLATSVRQILIPNAVDAAFLHEWLRPGLSPAAIAATSAISWHYGFGTGRAGVETVNTIFH